MKSHQQNKPHQNLKRFYTLAEVSAAVGISQSHIRKLSNDGQFPSPIKLSVQKTVWVIQEVEDWINEKLVKREGV